MSRLHRNHARSKLTTAERAVNRGSMCGPENGITQEHAHTRREWSAGSDRCAGQGVANSIIEQRFSIPNGPFPKSQSSRR
jgi:hypothetical protein